MTSIFDNTLNRGQISPIYDAPRYFSERNIPLVTQPDDIFLHDVGSKPILTVENYDKWYKVYLIKPDGIVEGVTEEVIKDYNDNTWYDHAIYPKFFHDLAVYFDADYDNRTFALVCERFVKDALEADWTRLHEYLPTTTKKGGGNTK